jgi:cellulose synthase/poly-beta-1,6-N-acetylglucosamine synthase-like glycosyltransferase
VRVLVPCFKESLAIIQRNVLAAKRADRPPGTKLFIYVCDDGNDEKKWNWVQQMNDPEVMYVTGRDKSLRSLNGKSANLNHCLRLLYPDVEDAAGSGKPDDLMKIPVNELMCLFDADQTCSKGFFQARRCSCVCHRPDAACSLQRPGVSATIVAPR